MLTRSFIRCVRAAASAPPSGVRLLSVSTASFNSVGRGSRKPRGSKPVRRRRKAPADKGSQASADTEEPIQLEFGQLSFLKDGNIPENWEGQDLDFDVDAAAKEMQSKYRRAWQKSTPLNLEEIDPHGYLRKELGIAAEEGHAHEAFEEDNEAEESAMGQSAEGDGEEEERVKSPAQVVREQLGMEPGTWNEVLNLKARKKADKKDNDVLNSYEAQQILNLSLEDEDPKAEIKAIRSTRIATRIQRLLTNVLQDQVIMDPALYPGDLPLEIKEVELLPGNETAIVRWALPMPARSVQVMHSPTEGLPWEKPLEQSPVEYDMDTKTAIGYDNPSTSLDTMVQNIHKRELALLKRQVPKKTRHKWAKRAAKLKAMGAHVQLANPVLSSSEQAAQRSLNHHVAHLRRLIGAQLHLRVVPRLVFQRAVETEMGDRE